jgi:hypothetical protein
MAISLNRGNGEKVARANTRAIELAPIILGLQAAGVTTQVGLARALNEASIPTTAGRGRWHPSQVRNVLDRLSRLVEAAPSALTSQPSRGLK